MLKSRPWWLRPKQTSAGPAETLGAGAVVATPPVHTAQEAWTQIDRQLPVRAYRVEYQAVDGDGFVILNIDALATASVVVRAHDLLLKQGIDARIRRIVPIGLR